MLSRVACKTASSALSAVRAMAMSDTVNNKHCKPAFAAEASVEVQPGNQQSERIKARVLERLQEREAKAATENRQMFVQKVDPLSGVVEWVVVSEEQGQPRSFLKNSLTQSATRCKQESSIMNDSPTTSNNEANHVERNKQEWNEAVMQSSYLDMLNDDPRNRAYAQAIRKGVRPGDLVLDIGTGTGLLSMLAAQALQTNSPVLTPSSQTPHPPCHVITCESFPPMAALANRVIQANGLGDAIRVINKRSDELVVTEGGDLEQRASLLLSEILDSELLGEGLLPTLRDAWARLLRPDARTIPRRARTFAQLVQCEHLRACHDLAGREAPLPDGVRIAGGFGGLDSGCSGAGPPAWAVHADALGSHLKPLSPPFPVFDFDFAAPPAGDRHVTVDVAAQEDGTAHGLITWWTIDLDEEGSINYSTAPQYALAGDALPGSDRGRDALPYRGWHHHWRQCAWPFPGEGFRVSAGARVSVRASHDDLGFWYSAAAEGTEVERLGESSASEKPGSRSASTSSAELRNWGLGFGDSMRSGGRVTKDGSAAENGATEHEALSGSGRLSANGSKTGQQAADTWRCTCGAHVKQSPERIGQLGDATWRARINAAVQSALSSSPLLKTRGRPGDANREVDSQGVLTSEEPSEVGNKSLDFRGSPPPTNAGFPKESCSKSAEGPRSSEDGGSRSEFDLRSGVDSGLEPESSSEFDVENGVDSRLEPGTGSNFNLESVVHSKLKQTGTPREIVKETSGHRTPVVLVADDSPLVPLLAAKHLTRILVRRPEQMGTEQLTTEQMRNEQRQTEHRKKEQRRTERYEECFNMAEGHSTEDQRRESAGGQDSLNGTERKTTEWHSTERKSADRDSLAERDSTAARKLMETKSADRNSTEPEASERNSDNARAASADRGPGRNLSRTPLETESRTEPELTCARVPRIKFLAQGGIAATEGFFESRVEDAGVSRELLPERLKGLSGEVTAADFEGSEVVALMAEPWYSSCDSGPPWAHALRFWHRRTVLDSVIAGSASILPRRAVLKGVAISAPELWDSRRALSRVEGFDHRAANRLLGACGAAELDARGAAASGSADLNVPGDSDAAAQNLGADCPMLPFPAWQCGASYKELSEPFELLTFDFGAPMTSLEGTAEVSLMTSAPCHGLALWMDYHAGGDTTPLLSTRWSPGDGPSFHKQGIQLFRVPLKPMPHFDPPSDRFLPKLRLRINGSLDAGSGRVMLNVRLPKGS